MKHKKNQEVIPSASRLIKSLRDVGYDFSTAVADLVDNSIEACATLVTIDIEFDGDDSWVRIADNGTGMDLGQLQEAMRYGSERDYDTEKDLGKFGLGLKTASMSQCQRMIVSSKGNVRQAIQAYSWDLDHINETNKWEIIKIEKTELKDMLDHHLEKTTGTVIVWQKLDRILGDKHPYGENAKKRLVTLCRELESHLAMVFHRFLSGEVPGKKLQININGNPINAWDPFARKEKKTRTLDAASIRFEHEGKAGTVILESYILPHQDDFSSLDAFKYSSGPKKWNRQQGFYIYRANRLIQSGGWSGLKTIDEHLKLARIAINFSPHLDEAFKINVAKMRVQIPSQIIDQVETAVKPVSKLAMEIYRKNSQKSTAHTIPKPAMPTFNIVTSNTPTITSKASNPSQNPSQVGQLSRWTLDEIQESLEKLAKPEERKVILNIFERFRKSMKIKK